MRNLKAIPFLCSTTLPLVVGILAAGCEQQAEIRVSGGKGSPTSLDQASFIRDGVEFRSCEDLLSAKGLDSAGNVLGMRDFANQVSLFKQSIYQDVAAKYQSGITEAVGDGNYSLTAGPHHIQGVHEPSRNHRKVTYHSNKRAVGTSIPSGTGRRFWTAFGVYPKDANGPAYASCSLGMRLRGAVRIKGQSTDINLDPAISSIYSLITRDNLSARNYVTFYSSSVLSVDERVEIDLCETPSAGDSSLSNVDPCIGSSDSGFVKTIEMKVTRSESFGSNGRIYNELAPIN